MKLTDEQQADLLAKTKERVFDLALQCAVGFDLQSRDAMPYVKSLVRDYYEIDDNGEILCNDNTPIDDSLKPCVIENIGVILREKHPYLFKQERAPLKDAPTPKPVQKSRADMSVAEKAAFVHRYGSQAYDLLPATPVDTIPTSEKRRSQMSVAERCSIIRSRGESYYLSLPE